MPEERVYICILNLRVGKWPVSCDYILGNQKWCGNCEIYLKESSPPSLSRFIFSLQALSLFSGHYQICLFEPTHCHCLFSSWFLYCCSCSWILCSLSVYHTHRPCFLFFLEFNVFIQKPWQQIDLVMLLRSITQRVTLKHADTDGQVLLTLCCSRLGL